MPCSRLSLVFVLSASVVMAEPVHFSRQIRPILSENCFACHGPDEKKREADLRLDDEAAAKKMKDGVQAIVPGHPEKSAIIERIETTDPDDVMPPPKTHKKLTPAQVALLKQWIKEGAPWGKHWSYETVQRPPVPTPVPEGGNAVDAFLAKRLAQEGLKFSPPASCEVIVRRLALDLTGLPPGEEDLKKPGAINSVVEYYLAQPSFGEHWARLWLDLARYADSSGYPSDQPREIYAYRDWVIRALNANMPFDQFTIEQIAGDLMGDLKKSILTSKGVVQVVREFEYPTEFDPPCLPAKDATLGTVVKTAAKPGEAPKTPAKPATPSTSHWVPQTDDDILTATAFHRNTMTQNEGGTSDEEFRNAAIIDRVNTTMAVWMGTSMACAQCHTHKYDPITNKEYFQFYAILNQSADADRKDETPVHELWKPGQQDKAEALKKDIAALEAQFANPKPEWMAKYDIWAAMPHKEIKDKPLRAALDVEPAKRTADQTKKLKDYYVRSVAAEALKERAQLATLKKEMDALKPVTVPIMKELIGKDRRVTHLQLRGNWQALDEEVGPGTPAVFPPLPAGASADRLAMARWLVDRKNPLTARVMMNRLWEQLFGTGIVRTSEEFGSQGELPFHPELLDWLAAEFMESGWDLKHMLTLLVSSRAYQQSSKVTPDLQERDPDNRLLARGPRFRPTGEQLRDQALAVSGLLSAKMYGPPVRPLAPSLGLTTAFGRGNDWTPSDGEDKHRRSLYTEVRRNAPYASFMTFDATNREVCTLKRGRTNTPLQAFVTLNDPIFIECAQNLARLMVSQGGKTAEERLRWLYRRCLARDPNAAELTRLTTLVNESQATYAKDATAATQLATNPIGAAPKDANVAELAAWTTVANVVMNLDEFVMRP